MSRTHERRTSASSTYPVIVDTGLSRVEIRPRADQPQLLTMYLDGVESSAIDLLDPTHLDFEYMALMQLVTRVHFAPGHPITALHLGAAGCALARAFEADYPNSRQLAAEIDPHLPELARTHFDLPRAPRLRIRIQDAAQTLRDNRVQWDLVIRDAFSHGMVPDDLRTPEFVLAASEAVGTNGLYLLNVPGGERLAGGQQSEFRQDYAVLTKVFANVVALAEVAVWKRRRRGNIVVVCANRELNTQTLEREVRKFPVPTRLVTKEDLARVGAY